MHAMDWNEVKLEYWYKKEKATQHINYKNKKYYYQVPACLFKVMFIYSDGYVKIIQQLTGLW